MVRESRTGSIALQLFSDGGFNGESGAFGILALAHSVSNGQQSSQVVGCLYTYVPNALSAFQMELLGLDVAVEILMKSATGNISKRYKT